MLVTEELTFCAHVIVDEEMLLSQTYYLICIYKHATFTSTLMGLNVAKLQRRAYDQLLPCSVCLNLGVWEFLLSATTGNRIDCLIVNSKMP